MIIHALEKYLRPTHFYPSSEMNEIALSSLAKVFNIFSRKGITTESYFTFSRGKFL